MGNQADLHGHRTDLTDLYLLCVFYNAGIYTLCVCCYFVVQLIDSGATRQQGVVKKISHDYGFLQSLSCPDTVYFNTAHVVQTRDGERLRVGSQVSPKFCW